MAISPYTEHVIVQMFEWPWASIKNECPFLGQAGYSHVQISPPSEHILQPEWFSSYAPVSYNLVSKRGDKDDLSSMISACKSSGVEIIVDAVVNHMTSSSGVSISGTNFEKYSYPGFNPSNFHYCAGNGKAKEVTNWDNATEVHLCELDNLADLAQEQPAVTTNIKGFLNSLIDLGVSGFRMDSAMLIEYDYLHAILSGLDNTTELLITQEISAPAPGNATPLAERPETYYGNGLVHEFVAAYDLLRMFTQSNDLNSLLTPLLWGEAWGYTASDKSNIFVTNHDTERYGGTIRWDTPNNAYNLATYFMLGYPYATPTILSGYNFTDISQPAPEDASTGITNQIVCNENGWRCEHRWSAFANMVAFRKQSAGQPVGYVSESSGTRIFFGRGPVSFLVINNAATPWTSTFTTGLPPGSTYCNIIKDSLTGCSDPITVKSDHTFEATIGAYDALALLVV